MSDDQQPMNDAETNDQEPIEIEEFGDKTNADSRQLEGLAERLAAAAISADEAERNRPPVVWREILAVLLMVALGDQTIYLGNGFAGGACFFLLAPILMAFGAPKRRPRIHTWIVGSMLVLLSSRLFWAGSAWLVLYGVALLIAFAMTVIGLRPFLLEAGAYSAMATLSGLDGMIHYVRAASSRSISMPRGKFINIGLPLGAGLLFGVIFILANPDLSSAFGSRLSWVFENLHVLFSKLIPYPGRLVVWGLIAWLTIGLIRPMVGELLTEDATEETIIHQDGESAHFEAFRNTLFTLIALFAVYLVFEFSTLWFREFPEGFYYAGYAHEGAGWLTAALALASVTLSAVFRGEVLSDSRCGKLKSLAWIWSAENLVLALAVFNRLWIYVGFNGMTYMRILGLFGVSTVVVGFIVVLWKIQKRHNFLWLVRRDLWTVFVAGFLFVLTPVDRLVVAYNVNRILAGETAACMQVGVKKTHTEAVPLLLPLLDCNDERIKTGVAALLADHHVKLKKITAQQEKLGWTATQWADRATMSVLDANAGRWKEFADADKRKAELQRFYKYAYQYY